MRVWRCTEVLVRYKCAQVSVQRTNKRLSSVREYCIEDVLVMAREGKRHGCFACLLVPASHIYIKI